MPSNVIHNYFAKQVKKHMDDQTGLFIDDNLQAYLLGAQGPDLMFYLKFEKEPLNLLGEHLHCTDDVCSVFQHSAEYARQKNSDTLRAFLLGQLCHYAADRVIHPYVYFLEQKLLTFYKANAHRHIHVIIESAFDYICLRDYMKVNTVFHKAYKNLNIAKGARLEIANYYSEAVAPLFDMQLAPEKADLAIRLMRLFMRICDDTTGIKYLLLRLGEVVSGAPKAVSAFVRPRRERKKEDWSNHNRTPFPKYSDGAELTCETFEELLERAQKDALALIDNFVLSYAKGLPLDKTLYWRNYKG